MHRLFLDANKTRSIALMDALQYHWDRLYRDKSPEELSWTQDVPTASLSFFNQCHLPHTARIIDVGGGDSRWTDYLLDMGYLDVTVLDISPTAIDRARRRLGRKAGQVTWIAADIIDFQPEGRYDLWHDRAAFHFLTQAEAIGKYRDLAVRAVSGYMILGTFSEKGPTKCSGLDVRQYSKKELAAVFQPEFEKITCKTVPHLTPFQTTQPFTFCLFYKQRDSV